MGAQVLSVNILTATKEDAAFKVGAACTAGAPLHTAQRALPVPALAFQGGVHSARLCASDAPSTSLCANTHAHARAPGHATQVPFSLTATRNDYLHALVAFFDITFGAGHKPVFFSTSPKAR